MTLPICLTRSRCSVGGSSDVRQTLPLTHHRDPRDDRYAKRCENKKAPADEGPDVHLPWNLVAGTGFEPVTFGL